VLILFAMLACGETNVEEAPVVSSEPAKPEAVQPVQVQPQEEKTVEAETEEPVLPSEEPEAEVAPEPVLLNAIDPNVNLPIYRHKSSGCYILLPTGQNDGSLNPVYQRVPTECPEEMMYAGWEQCLEGDLRQIGEACECQILVGRPLPPAVSVECPKPDTEPTEENPAENPEAVSTEDTEAGQ
jgi:hypothetical protein